jgi:hypothetical protein
VLSLAAAALLAAGVAHRPAVAGDHADEQAALAGVHAYVLSQAPAYRAGLSRVDTVRVDRNLYRACVPGRQDWLCLYVKTDQRPAGVTRDGDRTPNATGDQRR